MEIAIVALIIINIIQAVDKYLTTQKLLKQVDDAIKAAMSRNLNEYLTAKNEKPQAVAQPESEEVMLSEATDEQFDKFIKTQ